MQANRGRLLVGGLVLLGTFLLTIAVLIQVYVIPQVVTTPLDIDVKNVLEGSATIQGEFHDIRATNYTKTDPGRSDDDVVVWMDATCIVKGVGEDVPGCVSSDDPEGRLLEVTEEEYASYRKSAYGIDDPKYVKGEVQPRKGLVGKFPFDSQKKTYPLWDSMVGDTVDVDFEGEDEIDGLDVYKYRVQFEDLPAEISTDIMGLYSLDRTYWVEPVTGSVVNVETKQSRKLDDGTIVADIDLQYTDETIATNVEDTKGSKLLIRLVTVWGRIIGWGGGVLALAAAALVFYRNRPRGQRVIGARNKESSPEEVTA
jgi:hypothetical protein